MWQAIQVLHVIAMGEYQAESQHGSDTISIHMGQELYIFEVDKSRTWCRGYALIPPSEARAFTQSVLSFNQEKRGSVPYQPSSSSGHSRGTNIIDVRTGNCTECTSPTQKSPSSGNHSNQKSSRSSKSSALDDRPSSNNSHSSFLAIAKKSFVPLANLKPLEPTIHIVVVPVTLLSPFLHSSMNKLLSEPVQPTSTSEPKPPPPPIPHLQMWNQASSDTEYVLTKEISAAIRIWCNTWLYYLFVHEEYQGIKFLLHRMRLLDEIRLQLILRLLTQREASDAKSRVVKHMSKISKAFGADLVARDSKSGRPLCKDTDLPQAAQEQFLASLAGFDVTTFDAADALSIYKIGLFHVFVDLLRIDGTLEPGFKYSIYLSLRSGPISQKTEDNPLTESFKIDVTEDWIGADMSELIAAMFRKVAVSVIQHARIYLVAVLFKTSDYTGYRQCFGAGASDLTTFVKDKSLTTSRKLTMPMFVTSQELRNWGTVLQMLMNGQDQGIKAASEIKSITISVKTFEAESVDSLHLWKTFVRNEFVYPVRSYFLTDNGSGNVRDSIYLFLGEVNVVGASHTDAFTPVWVELTSKSKTLLFTEAANETKMETWSSGIVCNKESLGEIVRISFRHNYERGDILDEVVIFKIHRGKDLINTLTHNLFSDDGILSTGNKNVSSKLGSLAFKVNYVGTEWNHEPVVQNILNWESSLGTANEPTPEQLYDTLYELQNVEAKQLTRQFSKIVYILFNQLSYYWPKDNVSKFLCQRIYDTLICVLNKTPEFLEPHLKYFFKTFTMGTVWKPILHLTMSLLSRTKTQGTPDLLEFVKACPLLMRFVVLSAGADIKNGKVLPVEVMVSILNCLFQCAKDFSQILSIESSHMLEIQSITSGNIATCLEFFHGIEEHSFIFQATRELLGTARTDNDEIQVKLLLELRKITNDDKALSERGYNENLIFVTIKLARTLWKVIIKNPEVKQTQLRIMTAVLLDQYKVIWSHQDCCFRDCHKLVRALYPLTAKLYVVLLNRFRALETQQKYRNHLTLLFSPPYAEIPIDSLISGRIFDETLTELGVLLSALSNYLTLSVSSHMSLGMKPKHELEFCKLLMHIDLSILNHESCLSDWLSLAAYFHKMVFQSLEYVGNFLIKLLSESQDACDKHAIKSFDYPVWLMYLDCLMKLICSEFLAFEQLSDVNRATVWTICGNIRQNAANLMQTTWHALGFPGKDHPVSFGRYQALLANNPVLIENVLDMCLVSNESVQKLAVQLLFGMAMTNWSMVEDKPCTRIETSQAQVEAFQGQIIVALCSVFDRRQILPVVADCTYFSNSLEAIINLNLPKGSEVELSLSNMTQEVIEFVDLLLDLKWIPPSDTYDDLRTFHSLNVFDFLLRNGKVDIFVRYVHALAVSNERRGNYSQAAIAYGILAKSLSLDMHKQHTTLRKVNGQDKSQFEVWAAITHLRVHYYCLDRAYEMAISAVKELMFAYETVSFNFQQLAAHSKLLSDLYRELSVNERVLPKFFLVSFLGSGFPKLLQGHHYIFEGLPWDRVEAVNRLLEIFPGAQFVTTETEVVSKDMQYLCVRDVTPLGQSSSDRESESLSLKPVIGQLDTFRLLKPLPVAPDTDSVEKTPRTPLNTWVECIVYTTYQPFPTIVPFSQVKRTCVHRLSPIGNALLLLRDNINKMRSLIRSSGMATDSSPLKKNLAKNLEVVLSNAILSPVNGGTQLYRRFFDQVEFQANDIFKNELAKLKLDLVNYADCISECLMIFRQAIGVDRWPYCDELERVFQETYVQELETLQQQDKLMRLSASSALFRLSPTDPIYNSKRSTRKTVTKRQIKNFVNRN